MLMMLRHFRSLSLLVSFVFVTLFAEEAFVSVMSETIDLETAVKSSRFIFVAKSLGQPKDPNVAPVYQFTFVRALYGKTEMKPGATFKVHPANHDLHRQIGEMQKRGDPTPIPIVSMYGPTIPSLSAEPEVVLLLSLTSDKEFQLALEGGYESVKKVPEILRYLEKSKTN